MIYLDIETARAAGPLHPEDDAEIVARVAVPEPPPATPEEIPAPAGWRDPDKIARWQRERRERLIADYEEASHAPDAARAAELESSPLRPLRGRVLCVGVGHDEDPVRVIWEASELSTLARLDLGLARYPDDPICAWNGLRFDLRFLAIRALHHGIDRLAHRLYERRPSTTAIDPYVAWCGPDSRAEGRLRPVARLLGVETPPEEISGADVPALWASVEELPQDDPARLAVVEQITRHARLDVEILRGVCAVMRRARWIP